MDVLRAAWSWIPRKRSSSGWAVDNSFRRSASITFNSATMPLHHSPHLVEMISPWKPWNVEPTFWACKHQHFLHSPEYFLNKVWYIVPNWIWFFYFLFFASFVLCNTNLVLVYVQNARLSLQSRGSSWRLAHNEGSRAAYLPDIILPAPAVPVCASLR